VTGIRGRTRRKLLDDLKEGRGFSHLKEEALDRTMWRARFGRDFGPVVRQTAKRMNWVDTRWQQYSTRLHTNSTQNTVNGKYITIKKNWKCGPCPVFASCTLSFALQLRKKHGKTSVGVVENCPDIPVAVCVCLNSAGNVCIT
jgi:hypothetical protein